MGGKHQSSKTLVREYESPRRLFVDPYWFRDPYFKIRVCRGSLWRVVLLRESLWRQSLLETRIFEYESLWRLVFLNTSLPTNTSLQRVFLEGGVLVRVSLETNMEWLRLVGSLKLQVSFAKEPNKRDDILQKRPIILRRLGSHLMCSKTCFTKTELFQ